MNQPHPLISVLVADHLAAAGRLREARLRLEETTTRHPVFDPAWDALLRLDYTERRPDLARDHAAQALRINPLHPAANLHLASFHMMDNRLEEAESALRAALRGRPDDPRILNDLAWCLFRQGRVDDALPFAGKAAALAPESAACLDTLGALMIESAISTAPGPCWRKPHASLPTTLKSASA
jgi:tetratricopeptide (TPR) repeat protein